LGTGSSPGCRAGCESEIVVDRGYVEVTADQSRQPSRIRAPRRLKGSIVPLRSNDLAWGVTRDRTGGYRSGGIRASVRLPHRALQRCGESGVSIATRAMGCGTAARCGDNATRDYHGANLRSHGIHGSRVMTDTIAPTTSKGAANQSGAHINKDAYKEAKDFLPLNGVDHVEFWVGNARQAAHYYRALWGFTPIAYAVDDAAKSWQETTKRGAVSAIEPVAIDAGEDGTLRRSAVGTYGSVRHSFIERRDYHGAFLPGFRKIKKPARAATGLSLLEIDHCVGNVALGDMNKFVDFYRDVFGFAQLIHYDDKVIHTEYSALMSKVMTNGNGRIKFPINEPATGKKKSQIQEFLDYYYEAGTQHIALRTEDIVGTVRQLRENGIEFLGMPHAYYEQLPDRVGDVGVSIETLEELGIEADRDEEGYLLQIFTRPIQDRPTFFFEIIERHGSRGFGVGNFKALFEAIEIEQARRGNL
jgi:4-hydroxyphenylpyruvate dioxygenase